MDEVDLFKMSGASAGTIAVILLIYRIGKSLMGKRLISNCCGRKMEVGIDVKDTASPVSNPLVIRQPSEPKNISIPVEDARTNLRETRQSEEGRSHQVAPTSTRSEDGIRPLRTRRTSSENQSDLPRQETDAQRNSSSSSPEPTGANLETQSVS